MARHLDNQLFRETRNAGASGARVGELIAAGAQVNRQGKYCATPLHNAVEMGRLDLVTLLLNAGADPNILTDSGQGRCSEPRAGGTWKWFGCSSDEGRTRMPDRRPSSRPSAPAKMAASPS